MNVHRTKSLLEEHISTQNSNIKNSYYNREIFSIEKIILSSFTALVKKSKIICSLWTYSYEIPSDNKSLTKCNLKFICLNLFDDFVHFIHCIAAWLSVLKIMASFINCLRFNSDNKFESYYIFTNFWNKNQFCFTSRKDKIFLFMTFPR